MAQLICQDLCVGYDGKAVLQDLSFAVFSGDYLCIVGENGSGKSTLMKTILGLQQPVRGRILTLDGLRKNEIGYLPQQTLVQRDFPASVREIVLSGCQSRCGLRPFYNKEEKMVAIHEALAKCSAENPVFYEDEVDIHLNPKTGADWQLRGQQKHVVTPGQNEKYYLAGALHSGTGKVSYVGGNSKGSSLFSSLLKHMKATYRRAKTITLIVDNYIIHKSRETLRWLKANPKFRVIYQPVYSPWVNHVERLWQALHETITRNHQCRSMWQLLKKVRHFMDTVSPFPGGEHGLAKV